MQLLNILEKRTSFSYSESFSYEVARMFAYILLISMNKFMIHWRLLQNYMSQENGPSVKRTTCIFRDEVISVTSTYNHLCLARQGNFSYLENWPLVF